MWLESREGALVMSWDCPCRSCEPRAPRRTLHRQEAFEQFDNCILRSGAGDVALEILKWSSEKMLRCLHLGIPKERGSAVQAAFI